VEIKLNFEVLKKVNDIRCVIKYLVPLII